MDLERELGTTLVIRDKKGLVLTDDGIYFRQRAEEIIELADKLEQHFAEKSENISGIITIGATEAIGSRMLAKLIRKFSDKYPLILPLREKVRLEILNWIGKDEKDLCILLSYTLLSNAVLLVEEGLGCAFCLDGALALRNSPNLCFIPISPEHTTRSVFLWRKNKMFSPATSLFIQEINMMRAEIK